MDWNPNSPALLGCEFSPRQHDPQPAYRIASPSACVAQRQDSTGTQTVNLIGAYVDTDNPGCRVMAEVLIAGDEEYEDSDITTTVVPVNGGTFATGLDNSPGAVGMTEVQVLTQDPLDTEKYLYNGDTDPDSDMRLTFDTAGAFTGRRIVGWRLVVVASRGVQEFSFGLEPRIRLVAGGGVSPLYVVPDPPISAPSGSPETRVYHLGEVWPLTVSPLTVAQVEEFDTGGDYEILLGMPDGTVSDDTLRVYQVWLEVDHVAENRKGRVLVDVPTPGRQWILPQINKPDDSAFMSKVNGQDITLVLRQPRWGGTPMSEGASVRDRFSVPYIEALPGSTMPVGLVHYGAVGIRADGTIEDLGETSDRVIGFHMGAPDGATQQPDSQPFVSATGVSDEFSSPVQQEITTVGAETYQGVIIGLSSNAAAGSDIIPGDDLVIELRRRSDNNLMAEATITPERVASVAADQVAGIRRVEVPFDDGDVALAAVTQYYVQQVTVPTSGPSWQVAMLNAQDVAGAPGTGSFNGATDIATVDTDQSDADLPIVLFQRPARPTLLAATDRLDFTSGGPRCGITGVPFVHLSLVMDPEPDPDTFAYFEIQAAYGLDFDDIFGEFDPVWQTIARITDINATGLGGGDGYNDFFPPIGVVSCWRARLVTNYGVASEWYGSDLFTVTFAIPDAQGERGYWFTHSAYPELSLGYGDAYDREAERVFDFPEADEVALKTYHGRDGYVAHIPPERRGVSFSRRLVVSAFTGAVALPGAESADPIRNLSRAALPFVCVRDNQGGQWFANVRVRDYSDLRPAGAPQGAAGPQRLERVTVDVTELTTVPSVTDATY